MKLKFYLRGLGIGIIFSALICSAGKTNASEPMSDSEIISRAKELGMVEGTVLSNQEEINAEYTAQLNENGELELVEGTKETIIETEQTLEESVNETEETAIETMESEKSEPETATETIESDGKEPETEAEATMESKTEESVSSEPAKEETKENDSEQLTESKEEPQSNQTGDMTSVVVKSGSGSYTVAVSCENAGLVASAKDFDDYLCSNGYANRISVGTFDIAIGSDYETIAKILTKSK